MNKDREMGFGGLKIANQMKKGLIFTSGICYRSARNHPFLVGFMFFLIFLYRSFPFLFSVLVSSSPVLVCTIALLGTLLSFGQPHIPEIEKDREKEVEKEGDVTHEIAALKSQSGVLEDAVLVERGESCGVDRYTGEGVDAAERTVEDRCLEEVDVNKVEEGDGLVEGAPFIEEKSREIHLEKRVIQEEEEEFNDFQCGPVESIHVEKPSDEGVLGEGKVVVNEYTLIQSLEDEDHEVENDKASVGSVDAQMGDSLEFPLESWKHVEDENEPSDTGSDGGESSSPDASMTDIMPLLDELHPLLDSESPQPVLVSHDDSDAASDQSGKSDDDSGESSEDTESQQEGDDDEDDEDDEEEEVHSSKEDATTSGIAWTEDDQKNLMDLGTSELERNQRLENLIIRRRARKSMKVMAEKNLIDLESADPPFMVPPILTRRRNPFDTPCDDSYDNMGLPPIPGSAPSVLAPRRNPFDLPYDSSEEKPDLKGDSFEQEFMALHQKDMLFRRHESFSVGPSSLGGPRQERQHMKWRPYFVPERMSGEGTSYSVFERQSSGFSDSKASSVPETESLSSAVEEEDTKIIEEDVPQEADVISNIDHVPDRVEDGRQSSEVSDSEESDLVEKAEIDLNVAAQPADEVNHHEIESSLATLVGMDISEVHLEADEEKYSSRSSSSRSSEVSDQSFELKPDEESSIVKSREVDVIEGSGIQRETLQQESDFSFMTEIADEHHDPHEEPVFDSSPRTVEKNFSSSSISTDLPVEMSEIGMPSTVSSETSTPMACEESEISKEILEHSSIDEKIVGTSSQLHFVEENESRSEEVHISVDLDSSASVSEPVGKVMMHNNESFQHEQDQVDQLNVGAEFQTREVHQEISENRDLITAQDQDTPSESIALSALQESPLVVEQVSDEHPNFSSSETNSLEGDSADKEEKLHLEHHQAYLSGYGAKIGDNQDVDEKLVSLDVSNSSSSHTKSVEKDSTIMEETPQIGHQQVTSSSSEANIGEQDVNGNLVSVVGSNLSSSETNSVWEDSKIIEETVQFEHQQIPSPGSHTKIGDQQIVDGKLVSVDGSNLFASETKSAEENSTGKEETPHDPVHSPVSDLNVGDHQNVDEKLVSLDVSTSSSSEKKSEEQNSTGNGEALPFEHDHVLLSSSDENISSHQHDDEKPGDSSLNVSSWEMSLSELEKSLPSPFSDKSTVKPSLDDNEVTAHEEPHEPCVMPVECIQEVGITNDPNELRSHGPEDNISVYTSLTSILPELSEKSLSSAVDPKYETVDGIENDNQKLPDLALLVFPVAASHVLEENVDDDEANEMKEFDEGLLAELDRVGDFSVDGVGLNLNEIAGSKNILFVEDDFSDVVQSRVVIEEETNELLEVKQSDSGFQLSRASSAKHVEDDFSEVDQSRVVIEEETNKLLEVDSGFQLSRASSTENVAFGDGEVKDSKPTQEPITDSDMQVIEARSLEDIDLVFKGIESVSEEAEVKPAESGEMNSGMPIIEARSLEDIDLALMDAEPMPRESEVEVVESTTAECEINLRMPMIEAKSLEDIELAVKDMELMSKEFEVKHVESIVLADPVIDTGMSVKPEIESSDSPIPNLEINSSMMPVIDARSLEDLDLAFKNSESMSKETELLGESKAPENDISTKVTENYVNSEMLVTEARSLKDTDVTLGDSELMLKETLVETNESNVHVQTEMPIIEAQSLEDISLAPNDAEVRLEESNVPDCEVNLVMPVLEDRSVEDIDTTTCKKDNEENDEKPIILDLPVLEARSIEDIDLAFKKLQGGIRTASSEEPMISIPNDETPLVESEYPGGETNTDLEMVEARSLEDIHEALKRVTEDNAGSSTKHSDSRIEESGSQSTSTAQTLGHGVGI